MQMAALQNWSKNKLKDLFLVNVLTQTAKKILMKRKLSISNYISKGISIII